MPQCVEVHHLAVLIMPPDACRRAIGAEGPQGVLLLADGKHPRRRGFVGQMPGQRFGQFRPDRQHVIAPMFGVRGPHGQGPARRIHASPRQGPQFIQPQAGFHRHAVDQRPLRPGHAVQFRSAFRRRQQRPHFIRRQRPAFMAFVGFLIQFGKPGGGVFVAAAFLDAPAEETAQGRHKRIVPPRGYAAFHHRLGVRVQHRLALGVQRRPIRPARRQFRLQCRRACVAQFLASARAQHVQHHAGCFVHIVRRVSLVHKGQLVISNMLAHGFAFRRAFNDALLGHAAPEAAGECFNVAAQVRRDASRCLARQQLFHVAAQFLTQPLADGPQFEAGEFVAALVMPNGNLIVGFAFNQTGHGSPCLSFGGFGGDEFQAQVFRQRVHRLPAYPAAPVDHAA